jgi:L-malate glycosyltransferase
MKASASNTKIYFCHLLNDYSGSPKVLAHVIDICNKNNFELEVFSSQTKGFLNISGIVYNTIPYQWSPIKLLTLLRLIWCQAALFFKLLGKLQSKDIIYINTLLPFGAALAGKFKNATVIYHIHETSIKPAILKKTLRFVTQITASEIIFVSNYLKNVESFQNINQTVIYNAISTEFLNQAKNDNEIKASLHQTFSILMLCSLKKYKGVDVFVEISKSISNAAFNLVVNATQIEIDEYFKNTSLPANLKIYPVQTNVHPFFRNCDLVLNLSDPEVWIETFGLTAIEAFAYSKPVIVPEVGGISEVVIDEICGYHANMHQKDKIISLIKNIISNPKLYQQLSKNAQIRLEAFLPKTFEKAILTILNK